MSRASASKRCWFFHNEDRKLLGPFNEMELIDFMSDGVLLRSTKVWDGEQATKWTPLDEVPGLLQRLRRKQRGFSELEIKLESVFSDKSETAKKHHTRSSSSISSFQCDSHGISNRKRARSRRKRDSLLADRRFSPDVSEEEKCGVSRPIPISRSISPSASATTFTLTDDRVSGSDVISPLPATTSAVRGHGRWMSTAGMSVSGRWDLGSEAGLISPNSCSGSFFGGGTGSTGGGSGSSSSGGPIISGLSTHRRSDWFVDPIHDVIIDDERYSDARSPRSNRVSSNSSSCSDYDSECADTDVSTTNIDDDGYYMDSGKPSRTHSRQSSSVRMVGDIFRQLSALSPLTPLEVRDSPRQDDSTDDKDSLLSPKVSEMKIDTADSVASSGITPTPAASVSIQSGVMSGLTLASGDTSIGGLNKDLLVIHQKSLEPSLISSEDGLDIEGIDLLPDVSLELSQDKTIHSI